MDILISNLSENVMNSDLQKIFAVYGDITHITIVRDSKSGQSKGAAFVVMPHAAQAEQAVLGLNHMKLDGKRINVQPIEYKAGEFNN